MLRIKIIVSALIFICIISCKNNKVETYALRLKPGMDLKKGLEEFVQSHELSSASLSTCVGSLQELSIRPANQKKLIHLKGHYEIVSLTGTFADKGKHNHLHISVSDSTGYTIGGHLVYGNIVYTTAELILLNNKHLNFTRETDEQTGFYELKVEDK